jgi:excisionase family DNA binding protein
MSLRAVPEPFITRRELAELMGVSVRTIDGMVARGMPSVCWGIRARRFRASEALAWARAQDTKREAA